MSSFQYFQELKGTVRQNRKVSETLFLSMINNKSNFPFRQMYVYFVTNDTTNFTS